MNPDWFDNPGTGWLRWLLRGMRLLLAFAALSFGCAFMDWVWVGAHVPHLPVSPTNAPALHKHR